MMSDEFEEVAQRNRAQGRDPLYEKERDEGSTDVNLLIGSLTIGLILSLLAIGVYISFRIFGVADITADGSITLGAATAAILIAKGANPALATIAGTALGCAAGSVTCILHTRFKIHSLLSGILVMTALYSINLHIMGRSNVPLLSETTMTTYAENLVLAAHRARPHGLGWALRKELVKALRDRIRTLNMNLEDRLDNAIGTLSGGQRQALTLLMATWQKPDLLLLDEHTAALDPKSADQVIRLTRELVEREKLTTLMVTHSMHQAACLGNRLIMMNKGEIIHEADEQKKQRLRAEGLLARFEEVRRAEQLDPAAAEMLRRTYI